MLLALPKTPPSLPLVIFHTGRSIELFFLLDHGPGHHTGEEHRAILFHGSRSSHYTGEEHSAILSFGSWPQPPYGRGALDYSFPWITVQATTWEGWGWGEYNWKPVLRVAWQLPKGRHPSGLNPQRDPSGGHPSDFNPQHDPAGSYSRGKCSIAVGVLGIWCWSHFV